ncbi:hypothetical protein ABT167_37670 [Streptomyces sp. NPDC001792]|uniref:hypothetical protein n=1 Tax=Streptomyces sp. NPDC001792 TaxID=3154524 RepID=UPI00332E3D92
MQGEFGFVEAEAARGLAGRVEFSPGVELGTDQAGGGGGCAALGVRERGGQGAGVAGHHALRPYAHAASAVSPHRLAYDTAVVGVRTGRIVQVEG